MSTFQSILNNSVLAEWAAATGTLILALVTVLITFIGDSYTRLIRARYNYEFNKRAYDFLDTSLGSWGLNSASPASPNITVEEFIDKFNSELLDKKIYLSICNQRKAHKYIKLAKKHAFSWTNNASDKEAWMQKIAKEMQKLSKDIGKESDIKDKKNRYPGLFK